MSPRRTDPRRPGDGGDPFPRLLEPRFSQSLERGLEILRCFKVDQPVLGIAEVADELGMSRSTTHRYMITLVELGCLERAASPSRKYRLSLGVTDLGMSALSSTGLHEHAHCLLEDLRKRTRFTASIAVLDGPEIVYVDRVDSARRGQYKIGLELREGSRLPAYCTALGKLLLADLAEPERREILSEVALTRRGPNTITTKKALIKELDSVSDERIATDDQELVEGLIAIAAPVHNANHEVSAAVSLEAHNSMINFEQLVDQLGPHLLAAADQISARLGYRRDEAGR